MTHPLEDEYDLTAEELLNAINERFRLKVALAGAVAEVQLEKRLQSLKEAGAISRYEHHDVDGYPDFTVWLSEDGPALKIEVKNVRDAREAFRRRGEVVAYKVEVQKTRAATGDPSSRYYNTDEFDIVAVCLGRKTGNYEEFFFVRTQDLEPHPNHANKLKAMQRVPLPESAAPPPITRRDVRPWHEDLEELLMNIRGETDE